MAQIHNPPSIAQTDVETQEHRVLLVIRVLFGATLLFVALYIILALFFVREWTFYAMIVGTAIFGLVTFIGLRVIRQGRLELGVWLVIGGMWVLWPVTSALIAGFGPVLGIALPLVTMIIATQTLPQKQINWAIIGSIVVGVVTFWLDSPELSYRLPIPILQNFMVAVTIVVVVIFGFLVARQFATYTLVTKLVMAFLLFSLLSMGTVAFFANRTITQTLTRQAGDNLQKLATSQALVVGDLIGLQVEILRPLSLSQNIKTRLLLADAQYGGSRAEIQAELERLDKEWREASDDSFIVQWRLTNVVSKELNSFQSTFPDHAEIFVTDKEGALIAATNRISDYYQADEEWWQIAYNNGQGGIYIGLPEFDKSSNAFGIKIALPYYNDDGTIIGILRTTYRLTRLNNLMFVSSTGESGLHIDLLFPDGRFLTPGATELEAVAPGTLEHLKNSADASYAEFVFEDVPSFVSQAPVTTITDDPIVANLGWTIITHQNQQSTLAPVQAQTRIIIAIGALVTVVAIIIAVGVTGRLVNPIIHLTNVAQQVIGGNLSAHVPVETGDEVGILSQTFNTMTSQLRQTIDTLEERVTERTQQLETVVEVGRRLSAILDLSDLMREVVTLTKETFDYYHVHIYLLEGDTLIMAEGYGEAGAEMKRRGHSIPATALKSLVARAAREGKIVVVENVQEDPDWLPNPLLPDTSSEMAIPVRLGSEVVGVLDVQSDKIGELTYDDAVIIQALADQIAIAFRNARMFTQTQESLYEAQKLQKLYTTEAWKKFGTGQSTTNYDVRTPDLPPLEEMPTPEVMAVLQQERTVDLHFSSSGNGADGPDGNAGAVFEEGQKPAIANALATPLKLRNEIIGVLGLQDKNPNRRWTEEEITLIESVSEQMSLAIENARLFDTTQQRAQRETLTRQIADKIRSAGNVEEILQTTVTELSKALGVSHAFIDLNPDVKPAPDSLAAHEG